jgi:hypothetical protein
MISVLDRSPHLVDECSATPQGNHGAKEVLTARGAEDVSSTGESSLKDDTSTTRDRETHRAAVGGTDE